MKRQTFAFTSSSSRTQKIKAWCISKSHAIWRFLESNLIAIWCVIFSVLVVFFFVVLFSESVADWFREILGADGKHQAIQFLGLVAGGVLVCIGYCISHKRAEAMEGSVAQQERGLQQERLKSAIEHLGNEHSMSTRLGGVYELLHLSKEKRGDGWEVQKDIVDILCAHVRAQTSKEEYQQQHRDKPSEEIQTILSLISEGDFRGVLRNTLLNLRYGYLPGAIFGGRSLHADFQEANLKKAIFITEGDFSESCFAGANLEAATLTAADFEEVNFEGVNFRGSDLRASCFQRSNIRGVNFENADLRHADFKGVDFGGIGLASDDYVLGHFRVDILQEVNLRAADLREANLQKANFRKANLEGANLEGANLEGAILENANVQGANLKETKGEYIKPIKE